jgi:hypothetical protein
MPMDTRVLPILARKVADLVAAAPAAGLEPGTLWWQAQARDRMVARLVFVPDSRIDVAIWWNRAGRRPDIQLVFGLYGGSVELGSLKGNGFDAPDLHRRGFGTFAVNVAVQALQRTCPGGMLVHGVLSNTAEAGLPLTERLPLEAGRRVFWRRFGLDVVIHGMPPLDYLRGRVGDMRTAPGSMIAAQFARSVALQDFTAAVPEGY